MPCTAAARSMPQARQPGRWRRARTGLVLLLAAGLLGLAPPTVRADDDLAAPPPSPALLARLNTQVQVLRQARWELADFHAAPSVHPDGGPSRAAGERLVDLPDTWVARGAPNAGDAIYRLDFTLPPAGTDLPAAAPAEMRAAAAAAADSAPAVPPPLALGGPDAQPLWALRIDRLSPVHELRLNGVLLHGRLGRPEDGLFARPHTVWVDLPPTLLRAGRNEIELRVAYGMRGGLSPVFVGPADALREGHELAELWASTLPRLLNIAGLALAATHLLLWMRWRAERLLGALGMLLAMGCVRNLSYFAAGTSVWHGPLGDWGYHVVQVLTAIGAAQLALLLAGRHGRRERWALWGLAGVLMLAGALGVQGGWSNSLRAWTYPLLLVLVVAALALAARRVRGGDDHTRSSLLLVVGVLAAAAGHDYLCWRGYTSVMDVYWLPFAVPLALAATTWHMMQRLVAALRTVEQLNTRLEARVAERTRALEVANQAKSRFISAAGHDLRQPAAAIGLLVGVLRDQLHEPAARALADRVDEATAALEGLLDGLLDLSRLEAGSVAPRLEAVALQPLFDAIAAHAADAARRKGLLLLLRPSALQVHSDRLLLERMLRNLVGNALRYTDRGWVHVAARRRGGQVRIEVRDSGRGIPLASQRRIFDEHVQLSGPRDEPGLGLGLAIVQRSAELLGHRIDLRSAPDQGSVFAITAPEASAAAAAQTAPVASPTAAATTTEASTTATSAGTADGAGSPPRASTLVAAVRPVQAQALAGRVIWLVEDDALLRAALVGQLHAWGAKVKACADAAGALAARQAVWRPSLPHAGPHAGPHDGPHPEPHPEPHGGLHAAAQADWQDGLQNELQRGLPIEGQVPELLITDLCLPDGDGLSLGAALREAWPALPVLLLTASTEAPQVDRVRASGLPVLHKPVRPERLLAELKALLGIGAAA